MRRNKLLLLLALLMTAATGAWAQNYLYLEVDPSDNTSATLKYGDPEGKPYFTGTGWQNGSGFKTSVETITVDASCENFAGNALKGLFAACSKLTSITGLGTINTTNVNTMENMFQNCPSLETVDLSGFNTASVTNMNSMFRGCTSLGAIDLSGFNTAIVTTMQYMFYNCSKLQTLDLSSFNTASVTDMSNMFYGCAGLGTLDLSGFSTSSVTTMNSMFRECSSLQSLDLSGFNTSSVTNMSYMFSACTGLETVDLSGLNTSGVTTMTYMFQKCTGLQTLDLRDLNTSSVTDMRNMFQNCTGLQTLDISSFNTGNVTKMSSMFNGCESLTAIFVGADWSVASSANSMFNNCTSLPNWDETTDGTHANTGADGYLNKVKVTANEGETGEFWATYYNEYKHLIAPTGTQVFKVALSGTTLAMNEITDRIVTKGEGVVLKGTSNSIILDVNATASDDNYSGNSLQGTMTSINTTGANNYYVLNNDSQGVGFYKLASGNTLEVNNAYLSYDGGGESDFFSIGGGSDPAEPSTYTVTMKEGAVDAENWTITPTEATTTGVAEGTEVTLQYNGRLKVKGVKATAQQ